MKRIATALVLVPAVAWLVLKGPEWALQAALAVTGFLAFREFEKIAEANGIPRAGSVGLVAAAIAGLALLFGPSPEIVIVLAAIAAMTLALRSADLSRALLSSASFSLGLVYIFGSFRCAIQLRAISPHWLMFALLLSWAGDTAAMYVGKSIGRRRMAPRVSPGKTWEGAAGSVIGAILAGTVYAHYFLPETPLWLVILLAAAGNIAGQIGDLAESAIKRGAGVKDSGSSLPGHGGWLDRIDSMLFCVPVVLALVLITRQH
jgi:phosphatidate cytidylyltransferase